jgi:hypothetical protein
MLHTWHSSFSLLNASNSAIQCSVMLPLRRSPKVVQNLIHAEGARRRRLGSIQYVESGAAEEGGVRRPESAICFQPV